jgi:hypothetical protein
VLARSANDSKAQDVIQNRSAVVDGEWFKLFMSVGSVALLLEMVDQDDHLVGVSCEERLLLDMVS